LTPGPRIKKYRKISVAGIPGAYTIKPTAVVIGKHVFLIKTFIA
jgi:hypothetical protein